MEPDKYYFVFDIHGYSYALIFNETEFIILCEYNGEVYDADSGITPSSIDNLDDIMETLKLFTKYTSKGKLTYLEEIPEIANEYEEFLVFYLTHLNKQFSCDPYLTDEEINSNQYYEYYRDNNYKKEALEYCVTLLYSCFCFYCLEEESTFSYENNVIEYTEECKMSKEVHEAIISLIASVIDFGGSEYVYNDGAYNSESGYSLEGYSVVFRPKFNILIDYALDYNGSTKKNYLEIEKLTAEYENYINSPSNIELVKKQLNLVKTPRLVIVAKQKLIFRLREVKPLGITSLKKLDQYLNLTSGD